MTVTTTLRPSTNCRLVSAIISQVLVSRQKTKKNQDPCSNAKIQALGTTAYCCDVYVFPPSYYLSMLTQNICQGAALVEVLHALWMAVYFTHKLTIMLSGFVF